MLNTSAHREVGPSNPDIPSLVRLRTTWDGSFVNGATWNVLNGDARSELSNMPDASFGCVVTSPPYFWLRDYDVEGGSYDEDVTKRGYSREITEVTVEY